MKSTNNHIGEKHGRLLIVGSENINHTIKQKCICDCGNIKYVQYSKLISGHTKSCGCLKNKYQIKNKRIFGIWDHMRARCDKGGRKDSKYYHDKGITYCDEWRKYENFQEWALNNGYKDNLTLDRKDGFLPYCPENCRWITIEEQQRNRSNCLNFTHDGETKTLAEWAKIFGIHRTTLHDRIFKLGYSFEEAIKKPLGEQKTSVFIEYDGEKYTQSGFAKLIGCTPQHVSRLRKMGYSTEQIVERVKMFNSKKELKIETEG